MARGKKSRPKAARKRLEVRAAPDGSEICLRCGLCCDGTLFNRATMEAGEHEFVESLGLVVEAKPDGGFGFQLPCHHLVDGACSKYSERRPETCGDYRCDLLNAYVAGTMGLDDVLPVVQLVRSLVRELEVEMGIPAGTYTRRKFQQYTDETRPWAVAPDDPSASEHVRLLVAYRRLAELGIKYFGFEHKNSPVESASDEERIVAQGPGSMGLRVR